MKSLTNNCFSFKYYSHISSIHQCIMVLPKAMIFYLIKLTKAKTSIATSEILALILHYCHSKRSKIFLINQRSNRVFYQNAECVKSIKT